MRGNIFNFFHIKQRLGLHFLKTITEPILIVETGICVVSILYLAVSPVGNKI